MASMMKAAQFQVGGPENLRVEEVPVPTLRQKEVLIKVYASAINRADTLQRKGLYPPPKGESDILGLEAVGTVEKLGPDCSRKWKIGDRVMALLPGGGNAEFVASREECLMAIPKTMSFTTAAAIPEVWLAAYQLLHTVGKVRSGDNVLIHAGGSGVGTAATQLSILAGAKPIITAGSQDKIDKGKSLGAVAGFNYKQGDFSQGVIDSTNGRGVDLILDCVGESFYKQNIEAVAVDGTWVVYGLLGGGNINGDMLAKLLRKRITITGTTLRIRPIEVLHNGVKPNGYGVNVYETLPNLYMYKESLIQNFTKNALPHFESGKLKPIIDQIFSFYDIGKAHRMMEENKNTGKIILKIREEKKDEL